MNKFVIILLLLFATISCSDSNPQSAGEDPVVATTKEFQTHWHWEDEFSKNDKVKLKEWIEKVSAVTRETIGSYQFDVHYHFHQSDGAEPVPYAHTSRQTNHQAVHFYVNPIYMPEEFLSDWTAQHEISHLSLPFLGKKNMWFSEGYATYLSRQIMIRQGYYTNQEFDSIYYHRIINDKNITALNRFNAIEVSEQLKQSHNYPSIYYLGSSYFYLANQMLKADYNTTLPEVVKQYQSLNRLKDKSLDSVLQSLDQIVKSDLFSNLYNDFQHLPIEEILNRMHVK